MLTIKLATMAESERDESAESSQSRDPRLCIPLLVALNRIRGRIALIAVGDAGGMSLNPDNYSYDWTGPGRRIRADPASGPSSVTLTAEVHGWGASPPVIPAIVHREEIDLTPLDIVDAIRAAVARARRAAPRATVVVWSPEVREQLEPDRRTAFERYCRRTKLRWVSLDAGVLTVDGDPIAEVDALGRSITVLNSVGLTPEQMDLIEFERLHWGPVRSKESLVRTHWGMPLVRYYQRLYAIMESAAARRYDPILVRTFNEAKDNPTPRGR